MTEERKTYFYFNDFFKGSTKQEIMDKIEEMDIDSLREIIEKMHVVLTPISDNEVTITDDDMDEVYQHIAVTWMQRYEEHYGNMRKPFIREINNIVGNDKFPL